jgi:hypothetical protein
MDSTIAREMRGVIAKAQARYRKAFSAAATVAEMRLARQEYERDVCGAVDGVRLTACEIADAARAEAEGVI